MNMQKIELGQVVKTKSNQIGTVVDINKKRTEASILIQDLDNKGEVLSETTITAPLVELKIIEEIEKVGQAVEKAFQNTENKAKELAKNTKESTKQISDSVTKFSKNKEKTLRDFKPYIDGMIEAMIQLIALRDKSGTGLLTKQNHLIKTINQAIEKESKVALRKTKLDTVVAQVDALTDINYFINGSFVEIGIKPNVTLLEDLPTDRYPLENRLFTQVAEFHTVGKHPVANKETVLASERLLNRLGYTVEEIIEFIRATSKSEKEFTEVTKTFLETVRQTTRDILNQKALTSTPEAQAELFTKMLNELNNMYAMINMPQGVFGDIVHNANMTKFYKDDNGNYYAKIRESDGKIMKSPDFVAPEPLIEAEVKKILKTNE